MVAINLGSVATGAALGAALTLTTLSVAAPPPPAPAGYSRYAKLDIFARALSTVEQHYVRPVDDRQLIFSAVRGLVAELDPHSNFLDPREARLLREEIAGAFGGVGMVVTLKRDEQGAIFLEVEEVVAGGPARRAGVEPGDRITRIAGRSVAQYTDLQEAILTIRGEPGTKIELQVVRPGESPRALDLVRERIDPPAVQVKYLDQGIGVLTLADFAERSASEIAAGVRSLKKEAGKEGLRGVVLDLRDNGGGLLDEAIEIVDLFVAEGVIVRTRGRQGRVLDEALARRPGTNTALPLVVLLNKASASASEIVAGALQDHRRALVVGERSYGKGSVQSPFELGDGSLLKLTTALYYTPADRLIQASGIAPDIFVGGLPEDAPAEMDTRPELEPERAHPRHLRPEDFGRTPPPDDEAPPAVVAAGDDRQLAVAVTQLLALNRVRGAAD